ncbi:argininosuccinate lyase [Robertmurraya yapensis]|uniref:Argininosuccinate lyase n=1 Tax=Bacillus yapensis TaxID=2492960 RepID=A0A3S0KCZ8_9BACI|nr:argininosuccinate lyase [Bacillus yapensis]RTR27834.1 argininosuccinate lyase [Bacillus yapensis]TKS94237.1 argininosuccinate lyase [Bacillus yapensis]
MKISLRDQIIKQEGTTFPSKTYTSIVLEPAYNEAKQQFIESMLEIHYAHLIMLVEQGLVSKEEAKKIAKAVANLDMENVKSRRYTGEFEDLFFEVEHSLIEDAGDIAGNLHIARSRNDMGIAIYRMTLRKKLLFLVEKALKLREALIELTKEHKETVMIGYTHTQQAQPTTLSHYLNAMTDMLTRDIYRLQAAYKTVNRSSMGAAALTTSGFAINRERMKELLGFDEMIDNAWDAVAGADYIAEAATAVQLSALNLGRSMQDFLLWGTQEYGAFLLSAPYVQISSIMPQKRNPVSMEHMRALLSSVAGDCQTVLLMAHNTPFGDIVDTEDDMQPYIWKAIEKLGGIYDLLTSVLLTMEVHKDVLLKRAKESFANVTELADTIVRKDGLSFRQAHHVVSSTVKELMKNGKLSLESLTLELLNDQLRILLGKESNLSEEELKQCLSPEYFVQIRDLEGGPSPSRMDKTIKVRLEEQRELADWLNARKENLSTATFEVKNIISEFIRDNE